MPAKKKQKVVKAGPEKPSETAEEPVLAESPKKKQKAVKTRPKKPSKTAEEPVLAESSEEENDTDDGGVTEEGMASLMKALGDDGLDDFDRAQLVGLGSDEGEEGSNSEEGFDSEGDEESVEEAEEAEDDAEDAEEEESEQDEEMALDEVDEIDEDAVPKQKIVLNNEIALDRIKETIKLDSSLPWTETLSLTYPHSIDVDVNDDLNRELAFYKQALHSADAARALAAKHKLLFTRPSDYFAEMVKSDAHMERIRQRLLNEKAGIKKSEDKRKEREGKKFGKQVQIEKLKERERGKKEIEERLKGLKRKRKDVLDNAQGGDDDFDVAVEEAISDRPAKRGRTGGRGGKLSRQTRDQKFGFGGAGRRSKQNTRQSTDDFQAGSKKGTFRSGGGGRGGKPGRGGKARAPPRRLGKSRRMAARSKS